MEGAQDDSQPALELENEENTVSQQNEEVYEENELDNMPPLVPTPAKFIDQKAENEFENTSGQFDQLMFIGKCKDVFYCRILLQRTLSDACSHQ